MVLDDWSDRRRTRQAGGKVKALIASLGSKVLA
jgi:hypothetical protein